MLAARDLALAGRLDGVSATLRPGEVTAICGPNGAGKSTLLSCLAGILAPDTGDVTLAGAALADMPARERARAIGYLPQGGEVAWDVSVEALVSLGRMPWQGAPLHRAHASREVDVRAVDRAMAAMDLEALRARPLSRLSGGERARALLARVLAGQPRWILADEPLAALDLGHAAQLMARLKAQAHAGAGVVLVLHDLAQAMNHADRVLVVKQSRLVADAAPDVALCEAVIADVWGVRARWIGEVGARALVTAAQ